MSFCETLRNLIEERGITQKRLAKDLCVAASTISGYAQGTSEPDFATLKKIAEYFNVSADYLLNIRVAQTKTDDEKEILRIFGALPSEQREIYIEQGKAMIRLNNKKAQNRQ